jgi:SAM-dependent methyltransferase
MNSTSYLLAGRASELERLRLQSIVWEPSARRLLHAIGDGSGMRAVDVGCGVIGWLRVLSEWVGPDGEVVGTDIDDAMLADAGAFVAAEALDNVSLRKDDLFTTGLEASSFDLVHARAVVAPLGRAHEQLETYLRLVRPGGTVVLEDPDFDSLRYNPPAPALGKVVALLREGFRRNGGDLDAGRGHLDLFRGCGIEGSIRAEIEALPPGHPYLRLPLQMFVGLRPRLEAFLEAAELDRLEKEAETELQEPGRWGTSFIFLQAWGRRPA